MPSKSLKKESAVASRVRLVVSGGSALTDALIYELADIYGIRYGNLRYPDRKKTQQVRHTRARLFAELVNRAADSEILREQLKNFYLSHNEYFSKFGKPEKKTEAARRARKGSKAGVVDEERQQTRTVVFAVERPLADYCKVLAFQVTGEGAISKLYRVLMYFFALKHRLLPSPPKSKKNLKMSRSPLAAKPKIKLSADPMVDRRTEEDDDDHDPVSVLVDIEAERFEDVQLLSRVFQMKRNALLRSLIVSAYDRKSDLVAYHQKEHKPAQTGSARKAFVLRLNNTCLAFLENLSYAIFNKYRKSPTISVIISYFAQKAFSKRVQ